MSLRTAKIISLLVTLIGVAVVWQGSIFRGLGNQQGYQPVQPINFSHKVHAGDNQIQCLYCHFSASAAEKIKAKGGTTEVIPPPKKLKKNKMKKAQPAK